jgi:RecA/RadA recombinase
MPRGRPKKKVTAKTFDLLSDGDYASQVKEAMMTMASKRKAQVVVDSYGNVSKSHVELLDNVYFQHCIGMKGLPHGTLIEVIGQDGIGKTSLVLHMAGFAMRQNSPFLLIESEAKPMDKRRVMRCLSTNPELSETLVNRLLISPTNSILEAVDQLEDWVTIQRETVGVPLDTPLVCAIDSFSKLMAPKEAECRVHYQGVASDKKSKTLKELGEGTNFEHSKYAQKWCRTLPAWLERNNVILIVVSHQNQKVDMGFGGGFVTGDTYNRTKIGGNAFNQNAALQLILTREGYLIQNGEKVGTKIKATIAKNSYGPGGGVMRYELVSRPSLDREGYMQPALFFDNTTAEWFAKEGILGTRVDRKRYTSEELGVTAVTAHNFCEELYRRPDIIKKISVDQNILGYCVKDSAEYELENTEEQEEPEEDQKA